MTRRQMTAIAGVEVVTHGHLPAEIAEYARRKIGDVARHCGEPVLYVRVKLTCAADPAVVRPARAQASLDVNGRLVRGQAAAATLREAIDLLEERLRHRLSRMARHWEARRGGMPVAGPHEWRHASEATHRADYFRRPAGQRQIVRHKAYELASATPDEAVFDMERLDYDFHLFTDAGSGQDAVVYRAGRTGYRLARLTPTGVPEPETAVPLTVSSQPAPRLTAGQAVAWLDLTGQPFLFYANAASGRGRLLYHRYDGHYGLVRPAG